MIITPLQIWRPNSYRDFLIIIVKQTLALPLPPDPATLLIASPPTVRILLLIGVTKICQRLLQLSRSPSSPCTECSYMITGIRRRGYAAGGGWPIYLCNRNSKWATRRNKWTSGSNVGYFGVVMRRRRVYVDKDREMVPFRVKFTTVLAGLVAVLWCWWWCCWWCLCGTRCEPRCVVLETFCCCCVSGWLPITIFLHWLQMYAEGLVMPEIPSCPLLSCGQWMGGSMDISMTLLPAALLGLSAAVEGLFW